MNHFKLLLLTTTISTISIAQDYSFIYEPAEQNDYNIIRDVLETSDNHLIVGYDYMEEHEDLADYYTPRAGIMKTDMDGAVVWSKSLDIPTSSASCTYEVAENAEGDYLLWGLNRSAEVFDFRAILSKISADGELLWTKEYVFEESSSYGVNDFQILPSGEMHMMISIFDKVIIMRTNADGDILWSKVSAAGPPDETGKNPGFQWLAIPDDGGMCTNKVASDLSLIRYNEDGEIIWSKRYNMGSYTHGKTIARSPNGNILIAGYIGFIAHIMEVSEEDGSIIWVKNYPSFHLGFSGKANLTVIEDDIILDLTMANEHGYVLKINETGEVLEAMQTKKIPNDYNKIEMIGQTGMYYYGSVSRDGFEGVIVRTENMWEENCLLKDSEIDFVATDYTDYEEVDFTPYEWDFTNESSIEIALVDESVKVKYLCDTYLSTEGLVEETNIEVYPNPSADGRFILNLPTELIGANYTLTDMTGKVILTGIASMRQSNIDLSDFPNGQYIVGIIAEGESYTQKLVVLK